LASIGSQIVAGRLACFTVTLPALVMVKETPSPE
jgi:hypothetical protein